VADDLDADADDRGDLHYNPDSQGWKGEDPSVEEYADQDESENARRDFLYGRPAQLKLEG
jgi:hypothetical protein